MDINFTKPFLNTAEASNLLGISINTLRNKCHLKQIAYYKQGRITLFKTEELLQMIENNRVDPIQQE